MALSIISAFTGFLAGLTTPESIYTVLDTHMHTVRGYTANSGTITLTTEDIIEAASASTFTLPTAVGNNGRVYTIDNSHTEDITLLPDGSETIQGESSQIIPPNSSITVYSNGVGWRII